MQILTFTEDNETYAIDIMQVKEIIRLDESDVRPIPGEGPEHYGIMYLRETPVSVFNANIILGLEDTEITDETRIIILEDNGQLYGFSCDAIREIYRVDEGDIQNPIERSRFIRGVIYCKERDETVIVLDHENLFETFSER
jgi:purine-binding chemotaxis protein CheW